MRVMNATQRGRCSTPRPCAPRACLCRAWLEAELAQPAQGRWDCTVAVTHFAPSLRSADPRYGRQPGTASFCNADDDLIAVPTCGCTATCTAGTTTASTAPVARRCACVCNARGLVDKGEAQATIPCA
jgi:hypothetical protein